MRWVGGGGGWVVLCFFFNDTATTEIYTLSLHDALPILCGLILVMWKPNVSLWLMKAAYDY